MSLIKPVNDNRNTFQKSRELVLSIQALASGMLINYAILSFGNFSSAYRKAALLLAIALQLISIKNAKKLFN